MTKHLSIILLLLSFSLLPFVAAGENKPLIPVYVYHQQPPYIIDFSMQKGLYFEFVKRLNTLSDNYRFEVIFIPRKRVERMLDEHSMEGILLGVNPKWFKDKDETKYLWSSVVFNDRDEIVSLKSKPVEYSGPDSLTDMVIAGVRGFYYYGINELVLANKAKRIDTVNEPDLFTMLLKQRADVTIISKLTFNYMIKENNWKNSFHLSTKPHDIYQRRILIPHKMAKIHQPLQQHIIKIQQDTTWQDTLANYK
jgi:polar amino acid transport system substrate-binding protein